MQRGEDSKETEAGRSYVLNTVRKEEERRKELIL